MSLTEPEAEETRTVTITAEENGARLDKALAKLCPEFSRSRLQALIEAGELDLNGKPMMLVSYKVKEGDVLVLSLPEASDAKPQAENIPLTIVYEDDDLIVIDKAAGMVVHPAVGHHTGTLVNALLYHCGTTLSGIGGVKRPGIVHRLDRETSGLMLVAKNDHAHHVLSDQLHERSLSRVYVCAVMGVPSPAIGTIETQIGRHPANRLKMAVVQEGRVAITGYTLKDNFHDAFALVECRLATGRTHQIRVHMQHLGYPLLGDPLYGPVPATLAVRVRKAGYDAATARSIEAFPRQALHAEKISFIHPVSLQQMSFSSALPPDFAGLLDALKT